MKRIIIKILLFTLIFIISSSFGKNTPPSKEEFFNTRQSIIKSNQQQFTNRILQKNRSISSAQAGFDVSYYNIDIDIDVDLEKIDGTVSIKSKSLTPDLDYIEIDLTSNMTVASVNGSVNYFTRSGDLIQIHLDKSYVENEEFEIEIVYSGYPETAGFGAFGFDKHGDDVPIIWSLSEPYYARSWWPCKDTPKDKADSVDITFTVPEGLMAVSNGVLKEEFSNGDGTHTFHWFEKYPITTYLVSIAASNYKTFSQWYHYSETDSMEVKYFIYPESLSEAEYYLTETVEMLTFFSKIYGLYPFIEEKYGIVQFPWGGGMEHQTITSQGVFWSTLTVHELAHQWVGDKITNASWTEIWLNEGFASYSEALFYEHKYGKDTYDSYMDDMDYVFVNRIYVSDTSSVANIFNSAVYDKAGWMLHMLRHIIGDDTFFTILYDYLNHPDFAYGNVTTEDFQTLCELHYGQELDWFFDAWIYQYGRPVYDYSFSTTDTLNAYMLNLQIEQTQFATKGLFPMPIGIFINMDSGDTTITIFNDEKIQNFSFILPSPAVSVYLDKGNYILKQVTTPSSVNNVISQPTSFSLYPNYPNPFNPETTIFFDVDRYINPVSYLSIYSVSGQKVYESSIMLNHRGRYSFKWNGKTTRGQALPSGLYIYSLAIDSKKINQKMLLIK